MYGGIRRRFAPRVQETNMQTRFIFLALAFTLANGAAFAQKGAGAKFGARDPRTCASMKEPQKGTPNGDQMKQILICQEEGVARASGGEILHLVTNVTMQVGKPRPFSMATDAWPDSDPSLPVYPVQGGYTAWSCGVMGYMAYQKGHNCWKTEQPHASGICYRNAFGDWVCKFMDINGKTSNACPGTGGATECLLPPPTEQ
jgi:hypothetical protein